MTTPRGDDRLTRAAEQAAERAAGQAAEPGLEPELLVITGMSGAGRSTTADVLEDLGWFVVDNLPPQMLAPLAELAGRASASVPRLAAVVDVRGRTFFTDVRQALRSLPDRGVRARVLFLDASDEALVRRFESVRRPHPLQGDGRITDGIARERELLGDLRAGADRVIDTSGLNVHQLADVVHQAYAEGDRTQVQVTVLSFGFKHGLPLDADNVVDVRFLPNPHWDPELRPFTGLDRQVSEYVLTRPGAQDWLARYVAALEPVLEGYATEHKRYATVAVGCTGGRHRSVAIAAELARRLAQQSGVSARAVHRDLGRE